MAKPNQVQDVDHGWDAHGRLMRKLDRGQPSVIVGITAEAGGDIHKNADGTPGGLTTVEIGAVHEFGSELAGIPERSFIRAGFDDNVAANRVLTKRLALLVITGRMSIRKALKILGLAMKTQIVRRIDKGIEPALKPATIARKGSSKPLIDKGQLKQSITFEVQGI